MAESISCGILKEGNALDQNYWEERWETSETGWDIGYVSPPLEEYIKQLKNKEISILIPGCGNAYEANFLLEQGFKNITLIDIAPKAVTILKDNFKNHPEVKVICEDYFQHQGRYDLIIEQTFFCALPTILRNQYVKKSAELLKENGKIVGLLFNKIFDKKGPPFGGTKTEYEFAFQKYFNIIKMEDCYNSIPPRMGEELFINLQKK